MNINCKIINCPACALEWQQERVVLGGEELCLCSGCGLWFCDPRQLAEIDYNEVYKTVEYQKEMFENLDSVDDWVQFSKYPTYSPFFHEIKKSPNAKLLDIGCGVGRFLRAAYSCGWDVKGIDVSNMAIIKGRENIPFPMLEMTAQDLMATGEKFDVVTAFEVLEHLISPIDMLKIAVDILKPNGSFFCTVPNIESLTVRNTEKKDWLPPVHVLYFTEFALRKLLVRAGFSGVRCGFIRINSPSTSSWLSRIKYYINRMTGCIIFPDLIGLWAVGSKRSG